MRVLICGGLNLGPRLDGKARGQWLGYDDCPKCRAKARSGEVSHGRE